jgi:carbonic anhydrase
MCTRLRRKHQAELEKLPDDDARVNRIAELNVQSSIEVLEGHPAIKKAMASRGLTLHGMVYDLGAGQLRLLDSKASNGL